MNVTVIGAGHGGQALSAHLSLNDCRVCLYATPEHHGGLGAIQKTKKISCRGALNGTADIEIVTDDASLAMRHADVVFLSLPSYAHESVFKKIIPYLKSGQIICTLAANFSSLCFQRLLTEAGCNTPVILVDFASLPYACRAETPGEVNILAIKKTMTVASLPAANVAKVMALIEPVFPTRLSRCDSVIELGLNITSGISHPVTALLNAGRIGKGKSDFYFYKEGVSEATAEILTQLDRDRQAIGQYYGYALPSYLTLMADFYGLRCDSIYEFFQSTTVHNQMKLCPKSMQDRYVEQDVPYVLVPWYSLGRLKGFESKVMRSVIDLSSLVNQTDYLKTGRHAAALGLSSKQESRLCG